MVQPHPSLLLVLDIDESLATRETRLEVSRCYGYVGSTVVRPHATPEDGRIANMIEMHVKLPGARYMRENTPEADALWNEVMQRWLFNQFHTVGNQMQIYNRRQREEGNPELCFDWLTVIFEGGAFTVRVKLNSVSSLPPECSQVIAELREALKEGLIAQDVECVYLPAPESYAEQACAWEAGAPEREAARLAAEQAEEEAAREAAAAREAEAGFDEAPDLVPTDPLAIDEESWQAELERKYSLPDPEFEIDYSIWGVPDADGAIRPFDSHARRFVEAGQTTGEYAVA